MCYRTGIVTPNGDTIVTNKERLITSRTLQPQELCRVSVHIGKKLAEVLEASDPKLSKTAFAKAIGRSRKNLYEIFESPTIDSGILAKASTLLRHDFSQYLVSPMQAVLQEPKMEVVRDEGEPVTLTIKLDPKDPKTAGKVAEILRILST